MGAQTLLTAVAEGLKKGALVPYLGPEAVLLEPANSALPLVPEALAAFLCRHAMVPGRIRRHATAAAQYIENFRHRKTLKRILQEAFAVPAAAPGLYRLLARLAPPLVVDTSYDNAFASTLDAQGGWVQIQGVSRAEVRDRWYLCYDHQGSQADESAAAAAPTLLYKPLGGVLPAGNFVVSDSDFVEVLTEIDIQTPIPEAVKQRRSNRGFVFFGCRFNDQLSRSYARQLMKRSAGPHYAVLPEELTANEQRFIAENAITVIHQPLDQFARQLDQTLA